MPVRAPLPQLTAKGRRVRGKWRVGARRLRWAEPSSTASISIRPLWVDFSKAGSLLYGEDNLSRGGSCSPPRDRTPPRHSTPPRPHNRQPPVLTRAAHYRSMPPSQTSAATNELTTLAAHTPNHRRSIETGYPPPSGPVVQQVPGPTLRRYQLSQLGPHPRRQ